MRCFIAVAAGVRITQYVVTESFFEFLPTSGWMAILCRAHFPYHCDYSSKAAISNQLTLFASCNTNIFYGGYANDRKYGE